MLGAYQLVVGLSALPASLIAGTLWTSFGMHAPFYFSIILTCTATLLLLFVREQHPKTIRAQKRGKEKTQSVNNSLLLFLCLTLRCCFCFFLASTTRHAIFPSTFYCSMKYSILTYSYCVLQSLVEHYSLTSFKMKTIPRRKLAKPRGIAYI